MSDDTVFRFGHAHGLDVDPNKEACLIMISGDFLGEVYPLSGDLMTIGRAGEADVLISDNGASRLHVKLTRDAQGWIAADLDSTNGTFLNAIKLESPTALQDGDKIRISDTTFKFSYHDADDTEYHRQLRELAVRDGLTQVYNHRYFLDTIAKEFNYAERRNTSLGLAIIDIDHFKLFNDGHGHPAGDYVLKTMCGLVAREAREYDTFSRIGGEEFALLLRDTALEPTIRLAERIRRKIEAAHFQFEEETFQVTISVGVAIYHPGGSISQTDELIEAADQQLYRAKHQGRNQVCYPSST